jgi:heme/copper-type cytochrome/quinol oxidase subunit 1
VPRLSRWFIHASLAYLIAGFSLGGVMLTLKALARYDGMARLMAPHVEFLLIGWTVQLALGVAFWILPRFEGGASRGVVRYAWLAFVLLNVGVILAALAPISGAAAFMRLAGRFAEAGAAVAFALHAWPRIRGATLSLKEAP